MNYSNDLGVGLRDVPDVHISFPYKNTVFDLYITSIEQKIDTSTHINYYKINAGTLPINMVQFLEQGHIPSNVEIIDYVRTTEGKDIEKIAKLEWPKIKLYRLLKSDGTNSYWILEVYKKML